MTLVLTALVSFALGALICWIVVGGRRSAGSAAAPARGPGSSTSVDETPDAMRAPDPELDAAILEYVSSHEVFHINDVCGAIEHPKGARFVRTHFHQLMERGDIQYSHMRYRV